MSSIPVIEGDAPPGYSMVTFDDLPMKPMLWYAKHVKKCRVMKKEIGDYVLTYHKGKYTLWVKKLKNSKMVGKGFGGK